MSEGDSFTGSELGNDIGLMGALLPFVLRACCGSMCWPVDRPATHAAAGAAARGIRGIGGFFCGWTGAVAGACIDHGSGQTRMPPQSDGTRGFDFLVWGIPLRLDWGPLREHVLTTGVVRHACRHRVTARGVFGLGDCFTRSELGNDIGLMGALLPFVLRVVAGACVGRRTGQPTAAAGGAAARGVRGGLGDSFTRSGVVRHACRHRVTARGVFRFREIVSHALPRPPAPFPQTPTHPHSLPSRPEIIQAPLIRFFPYFMLFCYNPVYKEAGGFKQPQKIQP